MNILLIVGYNRKKSPIIKKLVSFFRVMSFSCKLRFATARLLYRHAVWKMYTIENNLDYVKVNGIDFWKNKLFE